MLFITETDTGTSMARLPIGVELGSRIFIHMSLEVFFNFIESRMHPQLSLQCIKTHGSIFVLSAIYAVKTTVSFRYENRHIITIKL